MNIPLSPRLRVCADFVTPGDRVADVGTDHGYLGIWLLTHGLAASVIASDIREGPLSAARANAERFGLSQQMDFYLSDGVANIPRDFDTLVIAGMGAQTMVHILEDAPWLPGRRLVLQPQNKPHLLRRWLSDNGWHIRAERLVRDGRFLYAVMDAVFVPAPPLTPGQCWLSPALLKDPHPGLPEYYARVITSLKKAALNRQDPDLLAALAELEENKSLGWLRETYYDNCK